MIQRLLPFLSLIILFVALSIASPHFLTQTNLSSVVRQTAVINIMALGMTVDSGMRIHHTSRHFRLPDHRASKQPVFSSESPSRIVSRFEPALSPPVRFWPVPHLGRGRDQMTVIPLPLLSLVPSSLPAHSAFPAAAVESSSDTYLTLYLPTFPPACSIAILAPLTIASDCGPEAP